MNGYSNACQIACFPGPDAASGYLRVTEQLPALVIYLDPVNLTIKLPPVPGGDLVLARFCRELAREAGKLAAAVDPAGEAETAGVGCGAIANPTGTEEEV